MNRIRCLSNRNLPSRGAGSKWLLPAPRAAEQRHGIAVVRQPTVSWFQRRLEPWKGGNHSVRLCRHLVASNNCYLCAVPGADAARLLTAAAPRLLHWPALRPPGFRVRNPIGVRRDCLQELFFSPTELLSTRRVSCPAARSAYCSLASWSIVGARFPRSPGLCTGVHKLHSHWRCVWRRKRLPRREFRPDMQRKTFLMHDA